MASLVRIACLGTLLLSPVIWGQGTSPVRLDRVIELPDVNGGFDHFGFDSSAHRLFLAASDEGIVETIDLNEGKVHKIAGFANPHSILVRSGFPYILVTDSGKGASAFVDAQSLEVVRRLPLALGANCVLYDSRKRHVYVTAGGDRVHQSDSTLQSIDADTGRVIASVSVSALHLQPMALDPATDRLFVNIADQDAIAIYDRSTLRRIGMWKIPEGHKNSPIALDLRHHRLFVIAADPGILMQINSETGALEASVPTPADPDDMGFDSSTQKIYVPGDRFLAVFDVSSPGTIRLIQREETGPGARTGMLIDSGRRFVVAAPAVGSKPARVFVFAATK
jgi:DNA-binding beta-propeller fold protein YncE